MRLQEMCAFLGPMYSIRPIDKAGVIYRQINDSLELEIAGPLEKNSWTVNLWMIKPHRELMAIYSGIRTREDLADTVGYLSFKYQGFGNLPARIQVEREDPLQ